MRGGIPVDETRPAIDQAVAIELDEDAAHRCGEPFVHREARTFPIRSETQTAKLRVDLTTVGARPLPRMGNEAFAPEIFAPEALLRQLLDENGLGGNRRMIDARKPVGIVAQHSMVARKHVHRRKGRTVPQVSAPGDVGRRHADDERRACRIGFFVKVTITLPLLVQTRFDRLRVVVLWEFHGCASVPHCNPRSLHRFTSVLGGSLNAG